MTPKASWGWANRAMAMMYPVSVLAVLVFGFCFGEPHEDNHLVYESIEGLAAFH